MSDNREGRGPSFRLEDGFTLPELFVTMGLAAILLTLAAFPLRTYWFVQALEGATDEAVTQLREQQEDSVSQAHPRVFGVRFETGSSDWTLFSYDPDPDPDTTGEPAVCTEEPRTFGGGAFGANVQVESVTITNPDTTVPEYTTCADAGDEVLFFYARGTSTGASIVLRQPTLNRTETVSVSIATGRVTRT